MASRTRGSTISASRSSRISTKTSSTPATPTTPGYHLKSTYSHTHSPYVGKGKMLSETSEPQSSSIYERKRKSSSLATSSPGGKTPIIDLTGDDHEADIEITTTQKKRKLNSQRKGKGEEKRLKMFRKKPPVSYLERRERLLGQRYSKSNISGPDSEG